MGFIWDRTCSTMALRLLLIVIERQVIQGGVIQNEPVPKDLLIRTCDLLLLHLASDEPVFSLGDNNLHPPAFVHCDKSTKGSVYFGILLDPSKVMLQKLFSGE